MSWNIGANDVANAMGTSVGSKALTLKKAVIIAAILEFSGAMLIGSNVTETMQSGLIKVEYFMTDPGQLVIGMIAALLATAVWLQIASYCGWPVSTTHAIVGSIVGFGVIIGGVDAIHWKEIAIVAVSWVLSPLLSGLISYLMFTVVQRQVLFSLNPILSAKRLAPIFLCIVMTVFCIGTGLNGMDNLEIMIPSIWVIIFAAAIGIIAALIAKNLLNRTQLPNMVPSTGSLRGESQIISLNKAIRHLQKVKITSSGDVRQMVGDSILSLTTAVNKIKDKINAKPLQASDYRAVEGIFSYLQIISACFVAFAHGANDVANAIGPVASVVEIISNPYQMSSSAVVSNWILALGGVGIVVGLATWGWRVIETIGTKITELTPSRGFCAEFGAATTILVASKMGLPISTTHCIVGAVLGIGLAKGISAINLRMVRDIVLSWIITIPSSAITSIAFYYIIKTLIGPFSLS
ncbi:MAG: inorganic phosphate transporter [Chlamydiales bacterium]|nr:inorganic phosphate transporter [Chlamydiales bacterium]